MIDVGFVVIGRNEGARLELCLTSVLAVSKRVVYADSASTDGSAGTAERLGVAVVQLPSDGRSTAARGRNAGYHELRARFPDCQTVQFLDGDCILQSPWIPAALQFLDAHPDVGVVCGRRFEAHADASIYNALCDDEWDTPVGEARECGGDALVRCIALDQIGGYNTDLLAGEEPEMTARMRATGWRIWRINVPMSEHDANIRSLRQWWRRTQRGGFGYAQVWTATKGLPKRLYGRQLRSALTWVVAAPLFFLLVALLLREPLILLLLPFAYALQMARIARNCRAPAKLTKAALILCAKIPEALGAARFLLAPGGRRVPEYKS